MAEEARKSCHQVCENPMAGAWKQGNSDGKGKLMNIEISETDEQTALWKNE